MSFGLLQKVIVVLYSITYSLKPPATKSFLWTLQTIGEVMFLAVHGSATNNIVLRITV